MTNMIRLSKFFYFKFLCDQYNVSLETDITLDKTECLKRDAKLFADFHGFDLYCSELHSFISMNKIVCCSHRLYKWINLYCYNLNKCFIMELFKFNRLIWMTAYHYLIFVSWVNFNHVCVFMDVYNYTWAYF